MREEKTILICGIGQTASAVAWRLFREDYAVAIQQETPPATLHRRMAFSDAWFDGVAGLEGVEARRAQTSGDFLLGLRSRQFIPVLAQPLEEIVGRWPWDVIIGTEELDAPVKLNDFAEFSIGLGAGYIAGENCDLVIETFGPDPGASIRAGSAPDRGAAASDKDQCCAVLAPDSGVFRPACAIGEIIERGDLLGEVEGASAPAPIHGRIGGMARAGRAVVRGEMIAEVFGAKAAPATGVDRRNRLIARGVAFAVEMEFEGWAPISFDGRG